MKFSLTWIRSGCHLDASCTGPVIVGWMNSAGRNWAPVSEGDEGLIWVIFIAVEHKFLGLAPRLVRLGTAPPHLPASLVGRVILLPCY